MDILLPQFPAEFLPEFQQHSVQTLLAWAMLRFYEFSLILVRISGIMIIGPLFGQAVIPRNVRVLLVLAMSFVIAPTISYQQQRGFQALDLDQNGTLSREEIPEPLQERFDQRLRDANKFPGDELTSQEFQPTPFLPNSLLEYLLTIIGELGIGFVLGLGVTIFLSGFQMAGELIDQQTGIALGGIFNPGANMSGGASGQALFLLVVTALLVMEPVGLDLLMVQTLVDTFQTLPPGAGIISEPAIEFLSTLVHQSLLLTVQVAAPTFAAMSLVALTMGFLGYTVPQVNVLMIGFPLRAMINIFILAFTLSGAAKIAVDQVPKMILALRTELMFL